MVDTIIIEAGMTCGGCSGAITRILNKIEGVSNVECSIVEKKVTVTSEGVSKEDLVKALEKWSAASGKYVRLP